MRIRAVSLLALGATLGWAACSTPQYRREGDGGGLTDGAADRKDMASADLGSGDRGDAAQDRAADGAQDRPNDLPSEGSSSDVPVRPDAVADATDAPVDAPVDAATDSRADGGSAADAAVDRATEAPLPAATISIDFGASRDLEAAELAGVVPAANWNTAIGVAGTLASLARSDGTASAATVTWMGTESGFIPAIDTSSADMKMMRTYVRLCYPSSQRPDAGSLALTVTISSLPEPFVSRGFDLYVYTGQDVPSDDSRSWTVAAGSATPVTVTANATDPAFNGTYAAVTSGVGQYVRFANLTGSSVTIKATPTVATRYYCGAITGLELVSH